MNTLEDKKTTVIYRILRWFVYLFYHKTKVVGTENLPDEPCIIVGNHSQMNGPLVGELHFPGKHYVWCDGHMMHLKEVPAYAFHDFWSGKPKWTHWFYRILSYIIAPIAVCVFNNAHTIGVYRDQRIISTFKNTITKLNEGNNIIIFPEHYVDRNHIICDFQDRFIDVAKMYYRKTGKELSFVPMYIAPYLKTSYLGSPIRFNADASMEDERRRICEYLMDEITNIACALPEHTVVPYRNLPRRMYNTNKTEVSK